MLFSPSENEPEPIIKSYKKIEPDEDGTNLREALNNGPVAIAFQANNDEFRRYKSGIYPSSDQICRQD